MKYLVSVFLSLFTMSLFAADGYEIKVKLDNYPEKILIFGYYFGDKQYIKDTAKIDDKGWFTFKGEKELEGGMYLIITSPEKQFLQILINKNDQHFSLQADAKNLTEKCKVKGSPENELFFEYMQWLGNKRAEAEKIKADIKKDSANVEKTQKLQLKLDGFDKEVRDYQNNLILKNKASLTAAILKGSIDIEVPKFEGTENEQQNQRYFWYKAHFFDNFDFSDPRLIRTPMLHNRTDYYLNKLCVQHPDSLIKAVDTVLKLAKKNPETYKYYLITLLNIYAKSNIVGQDALYVYITENYYAKGECDSWIEKEEKDKIIRNAQDLTPTLLGKTGQDLILEKEDGSKLRLYDIKTPYTLLLFWAPDCGHCQKEMPDLIKFYNKWKGKGLTMVSICNKHTDKVPDCWKYIKEHPGMDWINTSDTYLQSKYIEKYYVKSTPQVFILDKDKKILMKKVAADQLDAVMDELIKIENEKMKDGNK